MFCRVLKFGDRQMTPMTIIITTSFGSGLAEWIKMNFCFFVNGSSQPFVLANLTVRSCQINWAFEKKVFFCSIFFIPWKTNLGLLKKVLVEKREEGVKRTLKRSARNL